jgi:hypothetical protein
LLVVDYAETRTGLQELLAQAFDNAGGPDMRVLLLARSTGEWWQQLITNSEYQLSELLAAFEPITLGPVSDSSLQPALFREAMRAFAGKLGAECPDVEVSLADPNAVVLVIHAAALLAVLSNSPVAPAVSPPHTTADVFAGLLRHEARYWQLSLTARGLRLDTALARRVVIAGCLVGADDEVSSNQLLASIADLANSALLRGQVSRWLHDVYPVSGDDPGGEWIGSLQPDLVAEHLVVSVLGEQPGLTSALLAGQPERRVTRALTLLARAVLNNPLAAGYLQLALQSDPQHLVIPALAVAVETDPAVGGLIKHVIESSALSYHLLEHIAAALPHESLALAETAMVVSQRLADESEGGSSQRGIWLIYLSNSLADLGHRDEALAAIEEAVAINRALAQAQPNEYLPDLATALNNQSDRFSDLGRREEALAAIEEAVAINRALAQAQPNEHLPGLAFSLNSLSPSLSDLGRLEEALAASEEAVAINRALVQARPDEFLLNLAFSVLRYASSLFGLGRMEEALTAGKEAVALYQELAQVQPDAYRPGLSSALNNQSNYMSALGRQEEALAAIEEAVAIRRALAQVQPAAFLPKLAMSLHNRSSVLHRLNRQAEALTASDEAVAAYRQLARTQPSAYLGALGTSLTEHAKRLSSLDRREESLAVSEEAVAIRRTLAQASPEAFLPDLAAALNVQAALLLILGRPEDAPAIIEEATATYRRLARTDPGAFASRLAQSLRLQAISLLELDRPEEALAASQEAVTASRHLAQASPSAFQQELAASLHQLAEVLTTLDRESDAAAARAEATQLGEESDG